MKIEIGDYLIETDERQFIVKAKRVVGEGRLTKDENVGKEYWQAIAYCTTFNSALKFAPQQAIRVNDDILVIKEKLEQIERDIKALDDIGGLIKKYNKAKENELENLKDIFLLNGYSNEIIEEIKHWNEASEIEDFIDNLEEERSNWGE